MLAAAKNSVIMDLLPSERRQATGHQAGSWPRLEQSGAELKLTANIYAGSLWSSVCCIEINIGADMEGVSPRRLEDNIKNDNMETYCESGIRI